MIELRRYQKKQVAFIQDRMELTDVLSIQSGTGTGKTYTILQIAKDYLEENPTENVVISTGFNNLVFLMEERAKEFGILDAKVVIGTKSVSCPVLQRLRRIKDPKVFLENPIKCSKSEHKEHYYSHTLKDGKAVYGDTCSHSDTLYRNYMNNILESSGQLIITNHSSLLVHQEGVMANTGLLLIDEAHTFDNFYSSYLDVELDKNTLQNIDKAVSEIRQPMQMIIKNNLKNGVELPQKQIDSIYLKMKELRMDGDAEKAKEFFETKPSISNYIERYPNYFKINKFYKKFELNIRPKIVLFSATVDEFTKYNFNLRESYAYNEYEAIVNYDESEYVGIPNDNFKESLSTFLKYVKEHEMFKNKDSIQGLILSTTVTDVNNALEMNGESGFSLYNNIEDFYNSKEKYKALVGSRRFFQGIDIPDLDFVCLNKLPFPLWDDKARALQEYLTSGTNNYFDPWKQWTIPKTSNDIIQSLGRLWRSPDSKGIVSIFGSNIEKFQYIIDKSVSHYRHGIKMIYNINDVL